MKDTTKETTAKKKQEAKELMQPDQLKACHAAIHTATVAAGAGGVIPIPVMDAVPISAAQVAMVIALGKIFGQKIGESTAKGIISAAASTLVGRSLVKMIPVVGWGVSAAVAAGITEAIGWSVAVDFAKNSQGSETSKESETQQEQDLTKESETQQEQDLTKESETQQEQDLTKELKAQQEREFREKLKGIIFESETHQESGAQHQSEMHHGPEETRSTEISNESDKIQAETRKSESLTEDLDKVFENALKEDEDE